MLQTSRYGVPTALAAVVLYCLVGVPSVAVAEKPAAPPVLDSLAIRGAVFDRVTGSPVQGARVIFRPVSLEDEVEGAVQVERLTGEDGTFSIPPVPVGTYGMRVDALGYATLEEEFDVTGAGRVEVFVDLVPRALELDPVVAVNIRASKLSRVGFYERRDRGFARSWTRQEIEERGVRRTTDLFRHLAGARVIPSGTGFVGASPVVRFRQGRCAPEVFLDGAPVHGYGGGGDVPLDELIQPVDIEGLEVYRGSAGAANPYGNSVCGTILIWTRDAENIDGKPFRWSRVFAAAAFVGLSLLLTK